MFLQQLPSKIKLKLDNENYMDAKYITKTEQMKSINKSYTHDKYTK